MARIKPERFLSPAAVASRIGNALLQRQPFAMIRVGDGEALAMAQENILPIREIQSQRFLQYAGITVPDLKARDELLAMIPKAHIVGLPNRWDMPFFSPLVEKILEFHQIDVREVCDCCINYQLYQSEMLFPLLKGRRILLIGRRSRELAPVLRDYYGLEVTGKILIDTYRQIPLTLAACRKFPFDIAWVAAGIPAVTICVRLAIQTGKVALDLGHLTDRLIEEYA